MKTALITGISGQDAAYLSQLLLSNDYKVYGICRKNSLSSSNSNLKYLGIADKVEIVECDLLNYIDISTIIDKYAPDEIYNLAAQSSVGDSFVQPRLTYEFNIMSLMNILESIRIDKQKTKLYQASSSEMFGKVDELPITGDEKFHPLSPYAVSKAAAHLMAKNYRESFGLHISTGILFNHESFLRKESFFIKKVIRESIKIKQGLQKILEVGDVSVRRDFGFAPKYVEAMYMMLQQDKPDDYIVCSGESVALKDIILYVFDKLEIPKDRLCINEKLFRPLEIGNIYGDNSKTKKKLGWQYEISFWQVLDILVEEELNNQNIEYSTLLVRGS